MLCSVCQSVLKSQEGSTDKVYMDLHCWNDKCPSMSIKYRPHIRVVLAQSPAPCRIIAYHLPFLDKGYTTRSPEIWYILEGDEQDKITTLYERTMYVEADKITVPETEDDLIIGHPVFVKQATTSRENLFLISFNQFLRISASDKMHEEAEKIYRRLKDVDIWEDYSNYSSSYSYPTAAYAKMKEYESEYNDDYWGLI